jgi:hypothetical protein
MGSSSEGVEVVVPERDGVPLTEELIRRKAEHNDGMLSTLEEIALHQLDIDKIECLNNCRCLMIVYLQSNLISKIEGLHKLKKLDYLNLALNNITKVENLSGCEALRKLDLTCNFVDLDEMASIGSLKDNSELRELYLTGNPCATHWESGYRDYVIATLPQVEMLDGNAVGRAERIRAMQRLGELERELTLLGPLASERKDQASACRRERQRKIDAGDIIVDENTTDEWCNCSPSSPTPSARADRLHYPSTRRWLARAGRPRAFLICTPLAGAPRHVSATSASCERSRRTKLSTARRHNVTQYSATSRSANVDSSRTMARRCR